MLSISHAHYLCLSFAFQGQSASAHSASPATVPHADAVGRGQRRHRVACARAGLAAAGRGRHQDPAAAAQAGLTGGVYSCIVKRLM